MINLALPLDYHSERCTAASGFSGGSRILKRGDSSITGGGSMKKVCVWGGGGGGEL